MERTSAEIDQLLEVLRKYRVSDFKQDQFGLHIKLESDLGTISSYLPSLAPRGFQDDFAPKVVTAEPYAPPPEMDDAVVRPVPYDLDELLPGAK